ncbi:MAG: tRNA (N(6)-L-threonylcarbamoyladenosine(37)-C(2))-methylthiotransferase MtaB [Lachnospiraceae bacterium]|nr:tRNA (N(6)-L-threonylcarbamoyladenosine(37)-C(2))-methylthiotransferase MtaB [Lachnospiraceae bacterium]
MKSVALHNLGCKVNSYELDAIQQMLQDKGYKIVPFDETADIYIINTCTVTNIADRKSRQMLHRAKKQNPDAVVVAVGCYVQTGRETVEKDEAIDLAIGNNKKKDLVPILEEYLREREENRRSIDKTLGNTTIPDLGRPVEYEEMQLKRTADHTRAYIKIQDGCNQFCSYCIIPFARGRVRSRRPSDVISEAAALVEAGYQEVVLTGIHISSYGIDLEGADLLSLIRELHGIEGLKRIRLGSLEPRIITREFAEGLKALPKVCPHFHLSLQSGCDETLKRMNRHYLASEYYEKVELLRQIYDMPAITTDVIVGFPGETEEEFEITRAFLEKVDFYEMHVFKYSRRQGTNAAKMKDQVKDEIKTERSNILLSLEREQSRRFRQHFIGRTVEVLMEEPAVIDGKSYMTGHTKEYVKVALETQENLSNRMITGRAEGFMGESMLIMNRQG